MELTLNINEKLARKIKGLSVLGNLKGEEVTRIIEQEVDRIITDAILEALDISRPEPTPISRDIKSILEEEDDTPAYYKMPPYKSAKQALEEEEEDDYESEDNDLADELDEDELVDEGEDDPLPDTFINEIKEINMAIKDPKGDDALYDDDIMADAQALAEDDEFQNQDDLFAAAAASTGGRMPSDSDIGDDTPIDEGGRNSLDVLPVDYGLSSVTRSDKDAVSFFTGALMGVAGDKTKRNGVQRKALRRY